MKKLTTEQTFKFIGSPDWLASQTNGHNDYLLEGELYMHYLPSKLYLDNGLPVSLTPFIGGDGTKKSINYTSEGLINFKLSVDDYEPVNLTNRGKYSIEVNYDVDFTGVKATLINKKAIVDNDQIVGINYKGVILNADITVIDDNGKGYDVVNADDCYDLKWDMNLTISKNYNVLGGKARGVEFDTTYILNECVQHNDPKSNQYKSEHKYQVYNEVENVNEKIILDLQSVNANQPNFITRETYDKNEILYEIQVDYPGSTQNNKQFKLVLPGGVMFYVKYNVTYFDERMIYFTHHRENPDETVENVDERIVARGDFDAWVAHITSMSTEKSVNDLNFVRVPETMKLNLNYTYTDAKAKIIKEI